MSGSGEERKLGRAVAALRTVLEVSQGTVAKAGGLSPDTISDVEQGGTTTSATLERIATGIGVSIATLDFAVDFAGEVLGAKVAPGQTAGSGPLERACTRAGSAEARQARGLVDLALARARRASGRSGAEEAGRSAALWARLEGRTATQRLAVLEEGELFRSAHLVASLCEESARVAVDSAGRAVALAELALEVASFLTGDVRRAAERFGWAFLANSRRVAGNLPAAEEAFARSLDLARSGAGGNLGSLTEARLLDLEASLRRDQRLFPVALDRIDRALATDPPPATVGRLLLKRAKILEESGDPEGAGATLRRAAPLVEAAGEPRLLLVLRFNSAENLFQLGRPAEAERLLPEVRELVERLGNDLDRVRFGWLAGRIASALGRFEEAVAPLTATRAAFVERGIAWDTALVTLELAAVLAELGRTAEVKALAAATVPLFQVQGVARETLATLQLFVEAVEQEALTAEMARRLVWRLSRPEGDHAD